MKDMYSANAPHTQICRGADGGARMRITGMG